MIKLTLPATIEKVSTRVDNTISIGISTQELEPEAAAALFSLKGKTGWMLFSESEMKESDIPKESAPEFKTDKSPSQRLRAVLYVYWKENTNQKKPFDNFYKEWTNKKIEEIKDLLP